MLRRLLILSIVCFSTVSHGRWVHIDADYVDGEENRDVEAFNDELSYRYPLYWKRQWDNYDNGFRMTSGSLDGFRTLYLQEIKFEQGNDTFRVGYFEDRFEDSVVVYNESEINFIYSPTKFFEFSLLATSLTYKKWSDLGAALRFKADGMFDLKVKGWLIDPYYNEKEFINTDSYIEEPFNYFASLDMFFGDRVSLLLEWSNDPLMVWDRVSEGYEYTHSRVFGSGELSFEYSPLWTYKIFGYGENKTESKDWTTIEGLSYAKSVDKDFIRYGFAAEYLNDRESLVTGIEVLDIDQDAENSGYQNISAELVKESAAQEGSRDEYMAFVEYSHSVGEYTNIQYGYHMNHVINDYFTRRVSNEHKFQILMDWRLTKNSAIIVNATWDIDKIAKDFPEYEKGFEAWGGGDLQAVIVF